MKNEPTKLKSFFIKSHFVSQGPNDIKNDEHPHNEVCNMTFIQLNPFILMNSSMDEGCQQEDHTLAIENQVTRATRPYKNKCMADSNSE